MIAVSPSLVSPSPANVVEETWQEDDISLEGLTVYSVRMKRRLKRFGSSGVSTQRGPESSALNEELCVWLVWFTGNTYLDQCVWPGPATRWVSRRLRQMTGLWDMGWRETDCSLSSVIGGVDCMFFFFNPQQLWSYIVSRCVIEEGGSSKVVVYKSNPWPCFACTIEKLQS